MRVTDSLVPYARNARTHSPAQIGQIAASIKEFGFLNPVIMDDADGGIIAGHGRVLAAQKLGLSACPCIDAGHLTEAQRRAFILADNKLALNAGWDDELLTIELADLKDMGVDIGLTGFSAKELKGMGVNGLGAGGDAPRNSIPESFVVIVDCTDEADQVALIEHLQAEGRTCRGSVT